MPAVIAVENLKKRYRYRRRRALLRRRAGAGGLTEIEAVAGISFEVEAGERVAIIGPNGAGKSTTLKMLTGVLEPSSGRAEVLGLTPWRQRKALAYRIGVVFGQRSQLWAELPPRASFDLLRRVYDLDVATFARRLAALSARFGLQDILDQPVNRLSLGQRMRCEIVASLLHAPEVLFLDEPTIGLDVTAKAAVRDFIRDEAEASGQTVLLTSHDTRDMELVCSRVIVINAGRIVIDQPTEQLRRRFLGRKLVTVQTAGPADVDLDLPGLTPRAREPHRLVIEVDTGRARLDQVVARLMALPGVEDISIEDPPMEEVIREIYAAGA